MNSPSIAPLVLSIRSVRKDRIQGPTEAFSLSVPSLDIRLGDKVLITGPSGSGKSTLLDMIGMVLRPDAADRFLFRPYPPEKGDNAGAEKRNTRLKDSGVRDIVLAWQGNLVEDLALWRRNIGYVLQTGGLLPFINVQENITLSRRILGLKNDGLTEQMVDVLGIRHLLRKLPGQLSVGERQRVAIARALAPRPALVLADEPTAALDPANAHTVLRLFSHMVGELGITLILVSHAPEQLKGMGFRHIAVRINPFQQDSVSGTQAVLDGGDSDYEGWSGQEAGPLQAAPPEPAAYGNRQGGHN